MGVNVCVVEGDIVRSDLAFPFLFRDVTHAPMHAPTHPLSSIDTPLLLVVASSGVDLGGGAMTCGGWAMVGGMDDWLV
jgi:hypothetical protein